MADQERMQIGERTYFNVKVTRTTTESRCFWRIQATDAEDAKRQALAYCEDHRSSRWERENPDDGAELTAETFGGENGDSRADPA